ncbi:MAG: KpsF/GutQ family sugar-phosphate isomerase [Candidimonas sp.]
MNVSKIAKRVIRDESKALSILADSIDSSFTTAIGILNASVGRIIITGMGKSGHIGKKIAATMASTGRPSFFVHPSEASHGDMGMMTESDIVIAISNSGETKELMDILEYCNLKHIPIIAITSNKYSTLGKYADVVIQLPSIPEACPINMVPTTSTTMTLALGDAIAVALYETSEFTSEQFHQYHPGGKLGLKMTKVDQHMHTDDDVPLVETSATLKDAILEITKKALGCVGVVEDGKLIGIITDGDIRRHIDDSSLDTSVIDIMTKTPKTVNRDCLLIDALEKMQSEHITSLFVTESMYPLGVIHIHDCIRLGF